MLQVWLLGQFETKLDARRVVLSARTAQSLLAYLMLSAGTAHRREKLAGLFWSDLPEENARRNLRTEIWRIRKALVGTSAALVSFPIPKVPFGFPHLTQPCKGSFDRSGQPAHLSLDRR